MSHDNESCDHPVSTEVITGADSVLATLEANDVEMCFANPGTSEMHFVSALDRANTIRGVLGLFEGVATGAADGYARMAGKPAATLLHLGPGLANGLSNLHNALRAQSPVVNIIGDHATYHRDLDAPLTSDLEGAARPFSHWVRTSPTADTLGLDTAESVRVAREGKVASLILPADSAWTETHPTTPHVVRAGPVSADPVVDPSAVEAAARILRSSGSRTAILLGTNSVSAEALAQGDAIAEATGARVLLNTFMSVMPRGAGRHAGSTVPYPVGPSQELLADFDNIILLGADPPVAFFAYPDKPSRLCASGTRFITLAESFRRVVEALQGLRDALGDVPASPPQQLDMPGLPSGTITAKKIGAFLGCSIPEQAIVVDESITTGGNFLSATQQARPHDWIKGTGGSIGYGMAASVGAALACPDRPVITLESDGSGMYMPQALWSQAREELNVTTLIFANRKYQILRNEMSNVGVPAFGPKAESLLDLHNPAIDWVRLSESMGVPARQVSTVEQLVMAFNAAQTTNGPHLIEIVL